MSVCVRMSTINSLEQVNPFEQDMHLYGFPSVCILMWMTGWSDLMKVLLQRGALVQPLSCVNLHVSVQFSGMFKCSMTNRALVRPFLCVYPQVD